MTPILINGSSYDKGRLGAEIAYVVAEEKLDLTGIIIEEISQGGKNLYTTDGKVVIQARLLTDPNDLSPANIGNTLTAQLTDLVNKVHQDFNNISAQTGYAILSYLDPTTRTIKTTALEVLQF